MRAPSAACCSPLQLSEPVWVHDRGRTTCTFSPPTASATRAFPLATLGARAERHEATARAARAQACVEAVGQALMWRASAAATGPLGGLARRPRRGGAAAPGEAYEEHFLLPDERVALLTSRRLLLVLAPGCAARAVPAWLGLGWRARAVRAPNRVTPARSMAGAALERGRRRGAPSGAAVSLVKAQQSERARWPADGGAVRAGSPRCTRPRRPARRTAARRTCRPGRSAGRSSGGCAAPRRQQHAAPVHVVRRACTPERAPDSRGERGLWAASRGAVGPRARPGALIAHLRFMRAGRKPPRERGRGARRPPPSGSLARPSAAR